VEAEVTKRIIGTSVTTLAITIMALTLLEPNRCFAADWPSIVKEAKARNAKFRKTIKDMTVEQEWKTVAAEGKMTSDMKVFKKGDKFRAEMKMQMPKDADMPSGMGAMENVVVSDGKDTWIISSFMGKQKVSGEESSQYRTDWDWWDLMKGKTKLVGSEKVATRECYVAENEPSDNFPFDRVWIDKKSFFLVKAEGTRKGKTSSFVNSDFKEIKGGFEIPYKTDMYFDGKLAGTATVKMVKINTGLSDDLFDPDKVQVKGVDMQEMMKRMMQKRE
jgi:outer membrane lipoprotein-sorting protein